MRYSRCVPSVLVVCLLAAGAKSTQAANLTVCASGCQFADPQQAINAAAPGDTVLLRAGETFVGNLTLPANSGTSWITIRSDAADAQLPADGVRLVPSGRPGANTSLSLLPRLVGAGGALKTTAVVSAAPGAHNYRLQFLDIDGSANLGYETLVQIGGASAATPPSDIVIDRVYMHGHPYKGMKRGVALNGVRCDVLNSYIVDIKAVNADSQGIAGWNGAGPFRIENNYIEAAAENILFGGSDPATTNLVPSDITVMRNYLTKPMAWENPILAPPASPSASAATGGALAAGTHYFKIVALMDTDSVTATSLPSSEVSATVGTSGAVRLAWTAVPGTDRYRIYRGTTAGGESRYLEVAASSSPAFTYTGSGESSGTPPSKGSLWVVKNVFELKNAQRVALDGNTMENNWEAGQFGYALVLTPRNADGTAPWSRVSDVTIRNNIVRHAAGVLNIAGSDNVNPSKGTDHVVLQNNLFYDIDNYKYHTDLGSGGAKAVLIGGSVDAPSYVTFDHNTFIHANTSIVYAYGPYQMTGFVFTSNLAQHHEYGIMGESSSPGNATIQKYFPSSNVTCNAIAGALASSYPATNVYPTVAQWTGSFVDFAGGDYHLASTTYVATPGCAAVPGVDFTALDSSLGVTSPTPPPTSNQPPVANPGGPYSAAPGAAVAVNGGASSDPDGSIAAWRWGWGDDVLVRAADLPASAIHGSAWTRVSMSDAAGGAAISNPDHGAGKQAALASPSSYVEFTVQAAAGVPYHLWVRMRAAADYYGNDSMSMQFSGAADANGTPIYRIGTADAAAVILEEGSGAGLSGWGWNDQAYGAVATPIYFATSGTQTIRIQQREDGISWDQLVLSAGAYRSASPGLTKNDTTLLPASLGTTSGVTASHVYAVAGTYPLALTVTDNAGSTASAATSVAVGATSSTLTAKAGGPYSGLAGSAVAFDGRGSVVPQGTTADYSWQFGDEIVLHARDLRAADLHGRWALVSDGTAADGVTLENADLGDGKIGTAAASPANYVEATFTAAANVPYHLWLRMRADGNSYANDSVWVQFSGTVTSSGASTTRIGTTDALGIVLEEGSGAGVSGWGWADASYGGLAGPVYFNANGTQTIRIQQREDGVRIDQIVISAGRYESSAPGALMQDSVVVPVVAADAHGAQPLHAYSRAGVFPVVLTISTSQGRSSDGTTATIK